MTKRKRNDSLLRIEKTVILNYEILCVQGSFEPGYFPSAEALFGFASHTIINFQSVDKVHSFSWDVHGLLLDVYE